MFYFAGMSELDRPVDLGFDCGKEKEPRITQMTRIDEGGLSGFLSVISVRSVVKSDL